MKKGIFLIIISLYCSMIFSLDLSGMIFMDDVWRGYDENGHDQRGRQYLAFSDAKVKYEQHQGRDPSIIKEYDYSIAAKGGVYFLKLTCEDGSTLEWLMLYSEEMIVLFDDDDFPFFFGSNMDVPISLHFAGIFPGNSEKASTELKENINGKEISYPANNMALAKIPNPWAEGAEGDGIGEIIEFGLAGYNSRHLNNWYLYFSNGYVSYSRPDLYKSNGRLKKIRITQPMNNQVREFDLDDTPNFQKVFLDKEMDGEKLILEILDVYPGEKYSDTCLNHIFYYEIYE